MSPSEALTLLTKEREMKQPPRKKSRVVTQFDSDNDDDGPHETSSISDKDSTANEPRHIKRNVLLDSDDDDDDNEENRLGYANDAMDTN